jgi:hypothetical protein
MATPPLVAAVVSVSALAPVVAPVVLVSAVAGHSPIQVPLPAK